MAPNQLPPPLRAVLTAGLLAATTLLSACGPKQPAGDLGSYDPDRRRAAISRFAASDQADRPEYLALYRLYGGPDADPDATVRAAAVRALAVHGSVQDVDLFTLRLREDPAALVRLEAARALQRFHAPRAAATLTDAVARDPDPDVQAEAARALGQYAQPAVIDTLIGALNHHHYTVVEAAGRSLRTLTGQDLPNDSRAFKEWADANPDRLFADRRPYRWQPYHKHRTFLDHVQFWRDDDAPEPRSPAGLGESDDGRG